MATLGVGSDDQAPAAASDLGASDDGSKGAEGLLAHYPLSGLGSFPPQISGPQYGVPDASGAAGIGLPGGFSSGVTPRVNGEADIPETTRTAGASHITVMVPVPGQPKSRSNGKGTTAFNPNTPFGPSDLTGAGTHELNADELANDQSALLAANQIDGVPVAAPEPGTLLLVANGVAAALGSRVLRRRRNKTAQQ